VDLLSQYLQRSQEIIGDRTREEMRYDKEVLRWLTSCRQIISDRIQDYSGRVVDSPGDNILAEFRSLVAA
jgi:hypothetical protein